MVAYGLFACTYKDRVRYRVTYAFDTPKGERTGSHVLETWRASGGGVIGRYRYGFRGEAAEIDLGEGKLVFAILAMGPTGREGGMLDLPDRAYRYEKNAMCKRRNRTSSDCGLYDVASTDWLARRLAPNQTPTLVTFADLTNPGTAKVIYAGTSDEVRDTATSGVRNVPRVAIDEVAATLGQGYSFEGATITIVASGWWPFSKTGLAWPEFLMGVPITREIERRLTDMMQRFRELNGKFPLESPTDPFLINPNYLSVR